MSNEALLTNPQIKPDFIEIKNRFHHALTIGQRADIRRISNPEALAWIPAFYRLLPKGAHADKQWRRIIFFLPFAEHSNDAHSLGVQLAKTGVSETRLFQMGRSNYPNDLLHLRRILQQVQPWVNWQSFGEMLYFWGDKIKRRLLEDYFLSTRPEK